MPDGVQGIKSQPAAADQDGADHGHFAQEEKQVDGLVGPFEAHMLELVPERANGNDHED